MQPYDPVDAWKPFEPTTERPWNRSAAAHLFRRAGFGANAKTLDVATTLSPVNVVERLIEGNQETTEFKSLADSLASATLSGGDPKMLSAAWVYRLLYTPMQLLEKVTLFWHGHFATGVDKVQDARMMWDQNQLIRDNALGDFAELTHRISQDPAMLIYLDSAMNRKAHPNENFARELMELFCLGEGNYSETDVLELARCFTGWEIKNKRFRKNRYQHDTATKTFLGLTGEFDGEDGVRVVLEHAEMPYFVVSKLVRFFVSDELSLEKPLLQPLAEIFVENDLQIAPVIRTILTSNLFFSPVSRGQKIKSPVELIVGTLRCFDGTTNTQLLAEGLFEIGQGLFYPPNVKGWDGGRAWINSSTLLGRANLMADILSDTTTRFDGQSLSDYLAEQGIDTVAAAVEFFAEALLELPLDGPTRESLLASAESQPGNLDRKMRSLLHAITALPICQIS